MICTRFLTATSPRNNYTNSNKSLISTIPTHKKKTQNNTPIKEQKTLSCIRLSDCGRSRKERPRWSYPGVLIRQRKREKGDLCQSCSGICERNSKLCNSGRPPTRFERPPKAANVHFGDGNRIEMAFNVRGFIWRSLISFGDVSRGLSRFVCGMRTMVCLVMSFEWCHLFKFKYWRCDLWRYFWNIVGAVFCGLNQIHSTNNIIWKKF